MWNRGANKKATGAALLRNIGRSGHIEISVFLAAYSRRGILFSAGGIYFLPLFTGMILVCSKSSVS